MLVKTFVQYQEVETGKVFDFTYQPGLDFKVALQDSDGHAYSPKELGHLKVLRLDEDYLREGLSMWPEMSIEQAQNYQLLACCALYLADYADATHIESVDRSDTNGENEAEVADEMIELQDRLRRYLTSPRRVLGRERGENWIRHHAKWFRNPPKKRKRKAKVDSMIRLAWLRAEDEASWPGRFEPYETVSIQPIAWLAMQVSGMQESGGILDVQMKVFEIFGPVVLDDPDYLRGFADGAIDALLEVAHEEIIERLPEKMKSMQLNRSITAG